ncbi:MAG: polyphosphate kinase 1 [Deltaproteobacteria bacterium]|nr:polyphosphate kinase 1 [Deltaproteobacteria bacterium]MBW1875712.1 polyphosphate kinase 1 [Deltaproteobacteria bacterium]MBW2211849.1 polyphosphate kinase 1 [Deltaproteobacteria bacterium]MBW2214489.1 polyphosphate kinase 1 [Deltaproteobacteria bacterium]MBW2380162.1 polyphosphate kinase 1 [Deltaproteobacteria bacterium]
MSSPSTTNGQPAAGVSHEEKKRPAPSVDLDAPEYYLNRELTWLAFVKRVLHEAEDARTPLLERVKFLAITSSILDEFFMKRIGGLKQQVAAGVHKLTVDGRTPMQQIQESHELIRPLNTEQQGLWLEIRQKLQEIGVGLASYESLPEEDQRWLRDDYLDNIFPLITPQAMDPAHPFPFVSNLSLNLLVSLRYPSDPAPLMARVKVPLGAGVPRFVKVRDSLVFVPLEDIMANNLDLLFPGMIVERTELFRVTRNADVESDEEKADDLLALIESELRERKFAPIVRLEVALGMDATHRGWLAAELGLDEQADVFEVDGFLGLGDLFQLAGLDIPEHRDPDHRPVDTPVLVGRSNIFHAIREQEAFLLHHPYEAFGTSVERFLREASEDPKVRAIKMTLYRTSSKSRVIQHLINAALNGKQVAVVVELKARFDEEANINWASKLEQAGIHVTYGVVGLKTHCKVILVVRRDHDGLRRYVHIGTGNYHEETAKLYSDMGLLTCDAGIGRDATELFNYLTTGYKPSRAYKKLLPAPKLLKPALLKKIRREIRRVSEGQKGLIQLKTNALEDVDITRALYEASQAGVHVDLLVRDSCRLRPGVPGLSDNIRVVSVVGRFLEHSRIYHFRNGGQEEYYIGSADCMTRNLVSRVEVLAPVEPKALQAELRTVLDVLLNDQRSAWDMLPDGSYVQRDGGKDIDGAHQQMIKWVEGRFAEANRLRRRSAYGPRGLATSEE